MIRVFIGVDPRQYIAAQVLAHSIWTRASGPVSITRLALKQLPLKRRGLTEFTFSRYLVPHLCEYQGNALFMDADMLCLGDVYDLAKIADPEAAVSVVKNPRFQFEWPSMMYFNNALCKNLTPAFIETGNPQLLKWAAKVGSLPSQWNHLVGYDKPRKDAKNVHFTQGIPCFPETFDDEYGVEWREELHRSTATVPWAEIMGDSVHAQPVLERMKKRPKTMTESDVA